MAVGNGTITRASKESTRSALDFYPTPAIAVHTLLDEEPFVGDVWECASGRGDISLVLQERGLSAVSSDIQEEDWICGENTYAHMWLIWDRADTSGQTKLVWR